MTHEVTKITRINFHNILIPGSLYERALSSWLASESFTAADDTSKDPLGSKYVRPGLILAKGTDPAEPTYYNKYIPYDTDVAAPVGADTAVAVLDTFEDLTMGDESISPIFHGTLIEDYCYVIGVDPTITATIKTQLKDIYWR